MDHPSALDSASRGPWTPDPRLSLSCLSDPASDHGREGDDGVTVPQTGILALGTSSHAYLEFDRATASTRPSGRRRGAGSRPAQHGERGQPRGRVPSGAVGRGRAVGRAVGRHGFIEPVVGPDGFTMPATQHDLVLWLGRRARPRLRRGDRRRPRRWRAWPSSPRRRSAGPTTATATSPGSSTAPRTRHCVEAPRGAGATTRRAGGSVLLLQKWEHETPRWMALDAAAQEQAIGRTKPDSIELDDKPETSHVARTDQESYGHIFRRNTPYGTVAEHGTMFVGFCAEQRPLAAMLDSMAGLRRTPRRAHPLHPPADRRVLRDPVRRGHPGLRHLSCLSPHRGRAGHVRTAAPATRPGHARTTAGAPTPGAASPSGRGAGQPHPRRMRRAAPRPPSVGRGSSRSSSPGGRRDGPTSGLQPGARGVRRRQRRVSRRPRPDRPED